MEFIDYVDAAIVYTLVFLLWLLCVYLLSEVLSKMYDYIVEYFEDDALNDDHTD